MKKRQGFTLIELLVVISVVVLLMAILFPSLQRARNQGRAVRCQAHLHHWGLVFSTYITDNDGWFMRRVPGRYDDFWYDVLDARQYKDLCFCPMAVKVNPDTDGDGYIRGGKFTAWQYPNVLNPDGEPESDNGMVIYEVSNSAGTKLYPVVFSLDDEGNWKISMF